MNVLMMASGEKMYERLLSRSFFRSCRNAMSSSGFSYTSRFIRFIPVRPSPVQERPHCQQNLSVDPFTVPQSGHWISCIAVVFFSYFRFGKTQVASRFEVAISFLPGFAYRSIMGEQDRPHFSMQR